AFTGNQEFRGSHSLSPIADLKIGGFSPTSALYVSRLRKVQVVFRDSATAYSANLPAPLNCCSLAPPPNILWLRSALVKQTTSLLRPRGRETQELSLGKYRKYFEFAALLLLAV